MRLVTVVLLGALMPLNAQTKSRKADAAPPSPMSVEVRTQLRMAYFAVQDLAPLEDGFNRRDAVAQEEVRKAKAMADTRLERLTAEHIETYLIVRESCHVVTTDYAGCEDRADSNRDQIIDALHLRKEDAK